MALARVVSFDGVSSDRVAEMQRDMQDDEQQPEGQQTSSKTIMLTIGTRRGRSSSCSSTTRTTTARAMRSSARCPRATRRTPLRCRQVRGRPPDDGGAAGLTGRRQTMAGVETRSFDTPDETRTPSKTKVELVRLGGATVARMTLEPDDGAECIKPIVGTDSCHLRHVRLAHAGAMAIAHEDGTQQEIRAGQAYVIEPGHTAWLSRRAVRGLRVRGADGRRVRQGLTREEIGDLSIGAESAARPRPDG